MLVDDPVCCSANPDDPTCELIEELGRHLVGRVGLTEAQQQLRSAMFVEALRRCDGNRTTAARLLRVDRRYVARACIAGLGQESR